MAGSLRRECDPGQLSRHPEVQLGMTLLSVDGVVVTSYEQGIPLLQAAGRPVKLAFSAAALGRQQAGQA